MSIQLAFGIAIGVWLAITLKVYRAAQGMRPAQCWGIGCSEPSPWVDRHLDHVMRIALAWAVSLPALVMMWACSGATPSWPSTVIGLCLSGALVWSRLSVGALQHHIFWALLPFQQRAKLERQAQEGAAGHTRAAGGKASEAGGAAGQPRGLAAAQASEQLGGGALFFPPRLNSPRGF